jgi:hypothetical protein
MWGTTTLNRENGWDVGKLLDLAAEMEGARTFADLLKQEISCALARLESAPSWDEARKEQVTIQVLKELSDTRRRVLEEVIPAMKAEYGETGEAASHKSFPLRGDNLTED